MDDHHGWNQQTSMNFIKIMTSEQITGEKPQLKVTMTDNNRIQWPLMFVNISTPTIPVRENFVFR